MTLLVVRVLHYQNDLSATVDQKSAPYWNWCYSFIYTTNAAIEGVSASTTLTPSVKSQLLGSVFHEGFLLFPI